MAYQERLEGELAAFRFQSEDGSFAVASIKTDDGEQTAIGAIGHLTPGAWLVLDGRWSEHPKFGKRFRVQSFLVDDPRTHRGLERYLAGGAVKGMGEVMARRAVERFGLELLRILDEDPDKLLEVQGIGRKRLTEIKAHCWTVFAPLVRALRQRRMSRSASYVYDRQRIDVLLSSIIAEHEDLLS